LIDFFLTSIFSASRHLSESRSVPGGRQLVNQAANKIIIAIQLPLKQY